MLEARRVPHKRMALLLVAVLALLLLGTPLWSGYFGPRVAAYVQTWRPWRSQISVQLGKPSPKRPGDVALLVSYRDPWPGPTRAAGSQVDYLTVERPSVLLP
jgi:hypothetical protein